MTRCSKALEAEYVTPKLLTDDEIKEEKEHRKKLEDEEKFYRENLPGH